MRHLRSTSKIWASAIVCLVIAQVVASLFLANSYPLTCITDTIDLLLMISASVAFALNGRRTECRQCQVWVLLSAGYAIEACSQLSWMYCELILKKAPDMSLADAGIFLAWTALILGFALRPHVQPTPQHQRLGKLDLLLLLLTGLYLYLFLVVPWQYVTPEPASYGTAYKFLAMAQDTILLSIVLHGRRHSSGRWRSFYSALTVIVALDTMMEYIEDTLANAGAYFSGSWLDALTAVCLAGMTFTAFMARGLEPASEQGDPESERYWRSASHLAAPVVLVLPLLAAWSFLDRSLPGPVWRFRVLLSLGAVVVFVFVGIVKQARLENELANANRDLLEASLTDALTGVRNRRFFTNSIDADVQQVLRSFASNPSTDLRNRDLVFYLIDIDLFKRINDQFGHQIGDKILIEVARRINSAARLSDAVIRWGGEEFLLVSRYTDRKEAHVLANRVLDAVGSKPYSIDPNKPPVDSDLCITCSIGWAPFPWKALEPKLLQREQVLLLADYALYQAKGSGRNRAVGLLAPGETVNGGAVGSTMFINGIPACPVTTEGPHVEEFSPPEEPPPLRRAAAGSSSH